MRPDGTYYRESRRRRLSDGGRRMRARMGWATAAIVLLVAVVFAATWILR
jgi:hypothetical protein